MSRSVSRTLPAAVVGALVAALLLAAVALGSARQECGRVALPGGYSARVSIDGSARCSVARAVVRDNFRKRIRRQTGGTGRTRKFGFRCGPAHGDEALCTRGTTTVFGYDLKR